MTVNITLIHRIFSILLVTSLFTIHGFSQDIEYIDLINLTHTDVGFTDHQELLLELHQRYIDIAVDAGIATQNSTTPFCWTAEVLGPVYSWWLEADAQKRKNLLTLIENGQFEVTDIPYGVASSLAANEAETANHWIPEDLRKKFQIETAMQNDVNGIGRALIMNSIDHGCKYLWMGINEGFGKRLFDQAGAFWWKMPDGKKIFVWQGDPYWHGYGFFEGKAWRYEGQSKAANTSKWVPNPGDFYIATEENVLAAHKRVVARIQAMQKDGYNYDFIITSFSNQWRTDNDPPFPAIADFVSLWNEMELKPRINLTTAGRALEKAEKRIGKKVPEFQGEWIDHWAFMLAAMPREVSAARSAARHLKALESPLWTNPLSKRSKESIDGIQRDLVQFYEHTYGANSSHSDPYGSHNLGQLYSEYNLVYRADAYAEWILSQQIRAHLTDRGEGLFVINTSDIPYTGWVEFDVRGLRGENIHSFVNQETGEKYALYDTYFVEEHYDHNLEYTKRFWVNGLKPNSVAKLKPVSEKNEEKAGHATTISSDLYGWPEKIKWDNNNELEFKNFASFFSIQLQGASTREELAKKRHEFDIYSSDQSERHMVLDEMLVKQPATIVEHSEVEKTPHSSIYRQKLHHFSVENFTRDMEIFNNKKMIRVKYKFDRKSNPAFENYFIKFPIPTECNQPVTSLGGVNYEPFSDQLPGSNKDFQVIDEWVYYPEEQGGWLWSSKDGMVVTFGDHNVERLRTDKPDNMNDLFAMIYNNKWYVDCIDNVVGTVEYEFYLQWVDKKDEGNITAISGSTVSKPEVLINPKTTPDDFTRKYLFENK